MTWSHTPLSPNCLYRGNTRRQLTRRRSAAPGVEIPEEGDLGSVVDDLPVDVQDERGHRVLLMAEPFFAYTDRFVKFTQSDKDLLMAALTVQQVEAKAELVSYDKRGDELYFILKGCVRKYYVKEGQQITIHIATADTGCY